jgi:hypothetical protein
MSYSDKQCKFLYMVGELLCWAKMHGIKITGGELLRSQEQQDIYVTSGASQVNYSKHQDKLAIDLNVYIDGKYRTDGEAYRSLGEKWEELGGRWGGRFGVAKEHYATKVGWDGNHFESK